jgi:hypothetical protein
MPLHIKGRCGGKSLFPLVTMRDASFNIIQDCKFKHEAFRFSGRASARLGQFTLFGSPPFPRSFGLLLFKPPSWRILSRRIPWQGLP